MTDEYEQGLDDDALADVDVCCTQTAERARTLRRLRPFDKVVSEIRPTSHVTDCTRIPPRKDPTVIFRIDTAEQGDAWTYFADLLGAEPHTRVERTSMETGDYGFVVPAHADTPACKVAVFEFKTAPDAEASINDQRLEQQTARLMNCPLTCGVLVCTQGLHRLLPQNRKRVYGLLCNVSHFFGTLEDIGEYLVTVLHEIQRRLTGKVPDVELYGMEISLFERNYRKRQVDSRETALMVAVGGMPGVTPAAAMNARDEWKDLRHMIRAVAERQPHERVAYVQGVFKQRQSTGAANVVNYLCALPTMREPSDETVRLQIPGRKRKRTSAETPD